MVQVTAGFMDNATRDCERKGQDGNCLFHVIHWLDGVDGRHPLEDLTVS